MIALLLWGCEPPPPVCDAGWQWDGEACVALLPEGDGVEGPGDPEPLAPGDLSLADQYALAERFQPAQVFGGDNFQQQNAASDEVVMTLREVSLVVQRMTGGLKNLSSTADRLNQLGLTIQLLAQSFHLDSPRSLKNLVEEWGKKLQKAGSSELTAQLDELVQGAPFIQMGYFVDTTGYPVALAYNGYIRPRLHFSTCWGCPGETGKILYRDPDAAVVLQP